MKEIEEISIKNMEKENRLKRIKEAKEMDKRWSKKIVEANRENEIQKKQKETLDSLQKGYDELAASVETLRSSMDSIAQKKDALKDLEEGTLE